MEPGCSKPRRNQHSTARRFCLTALLLILMFAGPWIKAVRGEPAKSPPANAGSHWAYQPLPQSRVNNAGSRIHPPASIDQILETHLKKLGIAPNGRAHPESLIRRVALSVTGLPPTPGEIQSFLHDNRPGAYERMVQRYLDSERFGERWAKHWLDAAGYADSNGYFSADTDRPLAFRYRDYVIRSFNRNKPFDQFVREQIAGDELAGWRPGKPATRETIELLEATHFLRNGQDGSGESDGNPDEVRTDRYYALESAMQIMGSSLLGITVQCAKCHDHKFEPWTQTDYYAFQAFLYPAFNIDKWIKPNDRVVEASLPGELENWQAREKELDAKESALRAGLSDWLQSNRVPGRLLFEDRFDDPVGLNSRWSNTAPGDDAPGGSPPVQIGGDQGPAAKVRENRLQIIEGGGSGDRWISTREAFQWKPAKTNDWIQASFDLIDTRLQSGSGSAERVGWFIALHDFNDNSGVAGGNILIDGHPGGPTAVQVDYPGSDAASRGSIGSRGYTPGHNYGIRITRKGPDQFLMEHLVDGATDGSSITLKGEDLPSGGFGFEYCCGRSFIVDNVRIESSRSEDPAWVAANDVFLKQLADRKKTFDSEAKAISSLRTPKPGRIAWVSDISAEAPPVPLLKRGNHKTPGNPVEPAFPVFLSGSTADRDSTAATSATSSSSTTGRRLAWAKWITNPSSVQSALLARVTVNRIWQHYFGVGIVSTPDNLGMSGARPTHPELLDWLAGEFVRSGWNQKHIHRLILESDAFKRSSHPSRSALTKDPSNSALWRFPLRRIDAESIRDSMLAVSGRLGAKSSGPYVPTTRTGAGEIVVEENHPDAFSRSIFLQQRRTQVATLLGVFDAPSVVFNCTRRADTTMPLQSLSLLNSDFAVKRARDLAQRLDTEAGSDPKRPIRQAFLLTTGRPPDRFEERTATEFLRSQSKFYEGKQDARLNVWSDFCQSLFAMNSFLYLE